MYNGLKQVNLNIIDVWSIKEKFVTLIDLLCWQIDQKQFMWFHFLNNQLTDFFFIPTRKF